MTKIEDFIGKTFIDITGAVQEEKIIFTEDNGDKYKMYHARECCEHVYIDDIVGDLSDLVGWPILKASEDTNSGRGRGEGSPASETWTFYNLATIKGSVTIRWYGSSNGCYSESVDIIKLEE